MCQRNSGKRCEELACPAEDDAQVHELVGEPVDERVDQPVDEGGDEQVEFEEEEQPEQDLHAAEIMLSPSKGLMLRLLRDANAPLEMLTAARNVHCPHCDLMARRDRSNPTCKSVS